MHIQVEEEEFFMQKVHLDILGLSIGYRISLGGGTYIACVNTI